MFFYLLAQFKAGGVILSTLLAEEPLFQSAVAFVSQTTMDIPWINQAEPDYLVCLIVFAAAVIVYVVYGGFRAVVWTDVMQGIVMFVGVILMLGMALWQVGGLETATRKLEKMTPPEPGMAVLSSDANPQTDLVLPKGTWLFDSGDVFRLREMVTLKKEQASSGPVEVLKITTPFEIEEIYAKRNSGQIPDPDLRVRITEGEKETDWGPYINGAGERVSMNNPSFPRQ